MNSIFRIAPLVSALSLAFSVNAIELAKGPEESQAAPEPEVHRFGQSLFQGRFSDVAFESVRDSYKIKVGDSLLLNMWGAMELSHEVNVLPDGSIFIPTVGALMVVGVESRDLQELVGEFVSGVYQSDSVGVHITLDTPNAIKVYVAGYVDAPGLYEGHSSDSVLRFVDQAGGVDDKTGSFRWAKLLRGGEAVEQFDFYEYMHRGFLPSVQLKDGDTLWVGPKRSTYSVEGEVNFSGEFEMHESKASLSKLLNNYAGLTPEATHVRVTQVIAGKEHAEYLRLDTLDHAYKVQAGANIEVFADKQPGSFTVHVDGEHFSNKELIVQYGQTLGDLLDDLSLGQDSLIDDVRLYRESVKKRQKEMLNQSLQALEANALTPRSSTNETAMLRKTEADLLLQWVERARHVEPKGQVVLGGSANASEVLLEPGDRLHIPRRSNLVAVHGEVLFPTSRVYEEATTVEDYIAFAGGLTSDEGRVLIQKRDGSFVEVGESDWGDQTVYPGDEIFVLPVVDQKEFQFTKEITTVMYQLALSAAVVLGI